MTDQPHWPWLMGPTNPVLHVWDHWLNQPVHDIRVERGDAA